MAKITTKQKDSKLIITISSEGEEWKKLLNETKKKLKANLELKGFRKGHVPDEIAEKTIKTERVWNEAASKIVDDNYDEVYLHMKKEKIISRPVLNITKTSDVELEAEIIVTILKDVKLGDLSKLKAKLEIPVPSKEEIKAEVDKFKNQLSKDKPVEKGEKVNDNDVLVIDFVGKVDGKVFDNGSAEDYELTIGSNTFIPGFEEQLIGKKIGEDVVVKVKFPETYPVEDLKSKEATFDVKIKSGKRKQELDPKESTEQLKKMGFDSMKDLEEKVGQYLIEQKKQEAKDFFFKDVVKEIEKMEDSEINIPDEHILNESKPEYDKLEQNLEKQGMKIKDYLEMLKTDKDTLIETQIKPMVKERILESLVYQTLLKDLKIVTTEEDFEEEYKTFAKMQKSTIEKAKEQIKKEQLENIILFNKLIEKLAKK